MASLTITSISVAGLLCPLVDTGKQSRTTYFSNGSFVIWEAPNVSRPAASPGTDVSLKVTLEAAGGPVLQGASFDIAAIWNQYKIAGLVDKSQFQKFITPKKGSWDRNNPTVTCSILPPTLSDGSQKRLPWAFNDIVEWNITIAGKSTTVATKLEIYILPSYIPRFMVNDGIPLGLLRLASLLPTWMKISDPTMNDWPVFAVKAVFGDSRLWYDNFSGASTYCSYDMRYALGSRSVETSCWIELWLSDMNGLTGEAATKPTTAGHSKFTRYPINCMDTAGLVQTIASLNLQSPNAQGCIIHMEKFGFINDTYLIGRHRGPGPDPVTDICNSPFYKSLTAMHVGRMAPERSTFARHYFLTIDSGTNQGPRVFDACCGPQTGTKTLPQYITAAIDSDAQLYSPNTYIGGSKKGQRRPEGPGVLSDAYYGPGVVSLATPTSFKRTLPPTTEKTLFQRMDDSLNFPDDLKPPFEGSPSGGSTLVATWTYEVTGMMLDPDTLEFDIATESQISIWRHSSAASAKKEYERRRASLTGYQETLDNDLTYVDTEPGYYMFYWTIGQASSTNNNNFLVVIDGNMLNSKIASNIVKKVKTEVLNTPLPDNTSIGSLVAPTTAQKVDTNFTMTLKPSPTTKTWWRGYKVETASGNVLFTSSEVATTEDVTLNFLARRPGHDIVYVTLYGPNLDSAKRVVGVLVEA